METFLKVSIRKPWQKNSWFYLWQFLRLDAFTSVFFGWNGTRKLVSFVNVLRIGPFWVAPDASLKLVHEYEGENFWKGFHFILQQNIWFVAGLCTCLDAFTNVPFKILDQEKQRKTFSSFPLTSLQSCKTLVTSKRKKDAKRAFFSLFAMRSALKGSVIHQRSGRLRPRKVASFLFFSAG